MCPPTARVSDAGVTNNFCKVSNIARDTRTLSIFAVLCVKTQRVNTKLLQMEEHPVLQEPSISY